MQGASKMPQGYYTKTKWSKYLRLVRYKNILEIVFETVKYQGKRVAMRWLGEDGESIESMTYAQLKERIIEVMYALHAWGVRKGDHLAVCAETSQYWAWADLGMQGLGVATVAIYPSLKPKEIQYVLQDSESTMLFIDTQENLLKFQSIEKDCPLVKRVVMIEKFDANLKRDNVRSWAEFIATAPAHKTEQPQLVQESLATVKEEDVATIIYTSGTTSESKGVMLTQKNILSDIVAFSAVALTLVAGEKPWDGKSITYMPYAHSYGRTVEEYGLLFNSSTINYVGGRTQEKLQKAFMKFNPTIVMGIPYLYQKLYEKVIDTSKTLSPRLQNIFQIAEKVGRQYYTNIMHKKKNSLRMRIKYAILQQLILKRIRQALGGKLQLMVTASAGINQDLLLFFWACGFHAAEGYGLTEAGPATHYSRTVHNSDFRPNFTKKIEIYEKIGSIGPVLEIPGYPYEPMLQKLSPDGELLLKGPHIMKGYWKKPELTKEAIDADGWLHTGDLAEIDADGYTFIKGRVKGIIKLATGKMLSAAKIEELVVPYSRVVVQIVLTGNEKKFLSALVVPYQQYLKKYCDAHGIRYSKWEDIIRNPEIHKLIKADIDKLTEEVADFSRPKRFLISSKMLSEDDGFLTPTLKFKRNKVYKDFKDAIDKLYEGPEEFLIMEDRMTDFYDQGA